MNDLVFGNRPYSTNELYGIRQKCFHKLKLSNTMVFYEFSMDFHYKHKYKMDDYEMTYLPGNMKLKNCDENLIEKTLRRLDDRESIFFMYIQNKYSSLFNFPICKEFIITEYIFHKILYP